MTFQVADGSVSCAVCLCGCLRVCVFACVPVCACVYACMVGQVLWLIVYLLVCLFVRCFCVCAVSVYVYVCARVRLRLLFCVAGLSQRCTPSGMRELSCVCACLIASCAIEGSRLFQNRLAAWLPVWASVYLLMGISLHALSGCSWASKSLALSRWIDGQGCCEFV